MSTPIPLAGVLGHPAAHSLSPRLHRHWLRRYALAGHYVPLEVAADDLRDVLATMPRMGFVGANVTIPHKETVLRLCDLVTDRAALVGAVNTLIFRPDGKIHGDNTDVTASSPICARPCPAGSRRPAPVRCSAPAAPLAP